MEEVETKVIPLLERASVGSPPLFRIFLLNEGKIQYYIEKVFSKASKEVLIAISHKEIINDEFFEKISSLKDKGAKIWMIITKGVYEFLKDKNIMVRENYKIADEMFGSGIISDEIILIFKNGNQLNALWSDHNYFVELGKIYFEHLWSH
jgi:sugar-specific transcriptional regulator TrmB